MFLVLHIASAARGGRMTGREIRAALILRGVTLESIAQSLGVTGVAVSRAVYGQSRSRRIEQALADALGRTWDDVFGNRAVSNKGPR